MNGLYALKPWYAQRLSGVLALCEARGVTPSQLTWAGVGFGALAGVSLATVPSGAAAAVLVGTSLAARLACANLDGGLARRQESSSQWGRVENELGDRLADYAAIAGLAFVAGPMWAIAIALAATLPSWVALAGQSPTVQRINAGPMGKSERCLVLLLIALLGPVVILLGLLLLGSLATALVRLALIRREVGRLA